MDRSNPVRNALVNELLSKETRANATLWATEAAQTHSVDSQEEMALDEKAQRLAGYLTALDEVLRLLEAR